MDLISKLRGNKDSRSMRAMLSRGKNVYNSSSAAAQKGAYTAAAKAKMRK